MKVLMTTDCVGGVWTYSLELSDALAEHGVEVTLAVMGAPLAPDQRGELMSSRVRRTYAADYALEWMEDPWRDVERAGEWLMHIADEVEPDLIHLNGYAHAVLPFGAPVLVGGHSDVLSWHQAVRRRPAGRGWDAYRDAVGAGLDAADMLVAPSRWMLSELVRLYDPARPRKVIHNGSRRAFARRPKEPVILTAGRVWDEAKNVQALVDIAPRLPWPVAVAGAGGRAGRVRALGRLGREAMDRALAGAAIFAEPARYEPFGLAALEAARAGCALVLGDIPSLREVWGDAATFVDPDDEDALEAALLALIADPVLRAERGLAAHRRAQAYSLDRTAVAYVAAYERLAVGDRVSAA